MSKPGILIYACVLLFNFCSPKKATVSDNCIIHFNLEAPETAEVTIYPYQIVTSAAQADSLTIKTTIEENSTTISLDTARVLRRLVIKHNDKRYQTEVFTGPGEYHLTMVGDKIRVKGPPIHDEYVKLDSLLGFNKYRDVKYKQNLSNEEVVFKKNYHKNLISSINEFSDSYPFLSMVSDYFWYADLDTLNIIIDGFDDYMSSNYYLKRFIDRKENLEKVTIGKTAPLFSLSNYKEEKISLSDYKGKYVLIDFWASWCKPCIKGIPELKRIKSTFPKDQFDFISISIDMNKDSWMRAVEQQQMPWAQLLDNNSEVSKTYAVTAIPHLLIISPDGKILYKTTGEDEDLSKKIDEIVKQTSD